MAKPIVNSSGTLECIGILADVTGQDNGTGLDRIGARRIYDAFHTTKPDGMGMGLSISMSIVEAHGGRLSVSPAILHGMAFHVSLPGASRRPS